MFDDEQVAAEAMMATFEHPRVGHYRGLASAYRFGESPRAAEPSPAPTFGQHSDAVLARHGYSADEIEALRRCGAVA
jgi:crotonobetainyl-CoA:carnitine CoA-transferase CaiB-like acyl-CoA transferase